MLKWVKSIFSIGQRKDAEKRFQRLSDIHSSLTDQLRLAQEKNNRLLSILESMSEGVMVIDAEQKILLVNSVLTSELNLKMEEVPGSPATGASAGRYFWEALRDLELNEMIKKGLGERISLRKEHTPPLSKSVFQIQVSPVFGKSEFLGVVVVFHDVTKLKELERLGSEFVANVSHELKTPLTSIMGFVETLKGGAMEDAENRIKFLHIIDEHSQKLHDLIEDLLVLSRLESGKDKLRKESFDLEKMLSEIFPLFENKLQAKKVKVSLTISPKPFLLSADSKLIEQAFFNLIDNAIKYNHDGGELRIRAWRDAKGNGIEFQDTGIGVPESDLVRIFERFYRVDRSRSRESGGTGLGLSIVKNIIERHGGRVEVNSVYHQGTTFTVFLP